MTSLTIATRPAAPLGPSRRIALGRTLRSEFTKIRSVRFTYWSLFLLVMVSLGWCVAFCAAERAKGRYLAAGELLNPAPESNGAEAAEWPRPLGLRSTCCTHPMYPGVGDGTAWRVLPRDRLGGLNHQSAQVMWGDTFYGPTGAIWGQ